VAITPLPDRPDPAQLRRRAKELKRAADANDPAAHERLRAVAGLASQRPTLAPAQLAIAREHGFASWARLVAEVERRTQSIAEHTDAFVAAVAMNRPNRAARLLRETPAVAGHDVFAAAAAGDADAVGGFFARDRALVTARDPRQGWTPLLYAAATCLGDPHAVTRLLLDHDADSDDRGEDLTALYAAVRVDAPAVVELLLERGADPNDGDALYHATELDDHTCLRLLLEHGATEAGSNALAHMLDADDADGTRLLLEHGADATDPALLRHAIWRDCGEAVIRLLIEHGANPAAPGSPPTVDQRRERGSAGGDLDAAPGRPQGPPGRRRGVARARRDRRRGCRRRADRRVHARRPDGCRSGGRQPSRAAPPTHACRPFGDLRRRALRPRRRRRVHA
jgi:ankyrin repeat protein